MGGLLLQLLRKVRSFFLSLSLSSFYNLIIISQWSNLIIDYIYSFEILSYADNSKTIIFKVLVITH